MSEINYIYGHHDPGGQHLMADAPGTIVYTVDVLDESPINFLEWGKKGYRALVRLNWSHHGYGTIPPITNDWDTFAEMCANFASRCQGVRDFTIANEPNVRIEWGRSEPVTPEQYGACYGLVYDTIKARVPTAQVSPAAIGPWNVDSGVDWIEYFRRIVHTWADKIDFLCLHTYSRGYLPRSITDNGRMDAPYSHLHNGFLAYKDFLEVVPAPLRHLPIDIKETNGNQPWPDVNAGWVQEAYAEIDRHNRLTGTQKIRSLCLFRWSSFDERWQFETKEGVHEDFRAAVSHRYKVQLFPSQPEPTNPEPKPEPNPEPEPEKKSYPLKWDPRLTERGVNIIRAPRGDAFRIVEGLWLSEAHSGGRHHIYFNVLDKDGNKMADQQAIVAWPGKEEDIFTEDKGAEEWWGNFPMSASRNEFSIRIASGIHSDTVSGIGMGQETDSGFNPGAHTSTLLTFQHVPQSAQEPDVLIPDVGTAPDPVSPPVVVPNKENSNMDALVWPAQGWITQRWGERPEYYQRELGIPYHNGLDIGNPSGSDILAVAEGEIAFVGQDDSYGYYVRIFHPDYRFHSFMGHLEELPPLTVGQKVKAGDVVGKMGNTGNSTGIHLHYEVRLGTRDTYAQGTFGNTKGRVDPETVFYLLQQGVPAHVAVDSVVGDENWERAYPIVLDIEGGLSLDPADSGNYYNGKMVGTKHGISAAVWGGQYDIPNLTREQALQIHYQHYWKRSGANMLPWPLALVHFDAFVQNEAAARNLLESSNGNSILYMSHRINGYTNFRTWSEHGKGWMRRCATILKEISKNE